MTFLGFIWSNITSNDVRPFLSCLMPLFQSKAKCKINDIEMILHFNANKTPFHKRKACTWPQFESESFWNLEMALIGRIPKQNKTTFIFGVEN